MSAPPIHTDERQRDQILREWHRRLVEQQGKRWVEAVAKRYGQDTAEEIRREVTSDR